MVFNVMKKILSPAVYLMDRLHYPLKFGLILFVVLIPLILSSVNLVSSANHDIEHLRNERQGLRYIKAVRQLIERVQQHRGLESAFLGGSSDFYERMMRKRLEVDQYLAELLVLDSELTDSLNLSARVNAVQDDWDKIKAIPLEQDFLMAVAFESHSTLVADLIDVIRRVASASEITLDPELDSYYLGVVVASNLINLTESMGQARAVGAGITGKGWHIQRSFVQLSVLSNNIDLHAKHSRAGLNIAIESNEQVGVQLRSAMNAHNQAIRDVQSLLQNILSDTDKLSISSQTVYDTATLAITDSYGLYDAIATELDKLYVVRIEAASRARNLTIMMVSMGLMMVIYLFSGLYLSVIMSVKLIGETTRQIARGYLGARLMLNSRDELQQVSVDFNAMADQRQQGELQVRDMLDASIREIAKRSAVEQALREQVQRNQVFLQNTYDGYFLISTQNGRLLEVNDSYCSMLKYDRETLLGMVIGDLALSLSSEEVKEIIVRGHLCFEATLQRRDGDSVYLDVSATLATEGEQHVIMAFCRDITGRKRLEKRRLQEVKEQRDVLVREANHRINNHLQGVINLLRNQAVDKPEIAQAMELAISQVDSIAVVHGLQSQTADNRIKLASLLQAICRAVGAQSASIQLNTKHLGSDVVIRTSDAVPVALIINELVQNAVKHSSVIHQTTAADKNNTIKIDLFVRQGFVVLKLTNTSAKPLPQKFDIGKRQGLGVGLTLVKDLLPRQGAELNLYGEGGLIFTELTLSAPVITQENLVLGEDLLGRSG